MLSAVPPVTLVLFPSYHFIMHLIMQMKNDFTFVIDGGEAQHCQADGFH